MHHPDDRDLPLGRTASGRHVAPGGWRRAVVGTAMGLLAGALTLVVLRDDADPVLPPDPDPDADPESDLEPDLDSQREGGPVT